MSEKTTAMRRPHRRPTATSAAASSRARARSVMKAPVPVLRSMTMVSGPAASFLDMIEAVISGTQSTVAVTSRNA